MMCRDPGTQAIGAFECGNFCGFVRTSDSILQRRMDINTGVLPMFESQKTCVHGLDDRRRHREKCVSEFESPRYTFEIFFGIGGKLFLTFPWIWCCVMYSRSH